MTREYAKQLLPIIQAFAEGEEIEYLNIEGKWTTADYPGFSSDPERYRVKLKPIEFTINCALNFAAHQHYEDKEKHIYIECTGLEGKRFKVTEIVD